MSKPFDATTRDLLEGQPLDWLRYAGLDAADVEVINSDLSTITTEADKIIRVNEAKPYLSHLELQSTYEVNVPDRALRYNVLYTRADGLAVSVRVRSKTIGRSDSHGRVSDISSYSCKR